VKTPKDLEEERGLIEKELQEESENLKAHELGQTWEQAAMTKAGFPAKYWLPWQLAVKWKTSNYPMEPSREAVAQWKKLTESAAAGMFSIGKKVTSRRILKELAHDLDLLRQYDAELAPIEEKKGNGSTQPAKPGRKRRYNWQKDQEIDESWKRAKGAGTSAKQFALDQHLSLTALKLLLNRVAKRNKGARK
jgi:hypothetical protein